MKVVVPALAAAFVATIGAVSAAHSATISIGTSFNGGPITLQSSGAVPGPVSSSGALGAYDVNTESGVDLSAASLNSNSLNASTTGTLDTLNIFVSASDITTAASVVKFLSGLTVNLLTPGWSVTETTFEDNSNTVFGTTGGTVTTLATNMFTGLGTFTLTTPVSVTSPFSVTEEFVIKSNGLSGSANNTIDLSGSTVIPEPSTWVMMVLGFIGLGYAAVRRSSKDRTAVAI